ncbi:nicotinate-nucleotide pyrophosphorylase [Bradyrhizobium sp. USDA 3397]
MTHAGFGRLQAVERLRRAAPEKKLVIEVKTADAALAAAVAGCDVIQAEKLSPAEIAALVKRMASMAYTSARPIIAAAGGVNAANAAAYAAAGAEVLVTSAPYLAKPRDVQVQIAAAEADRRSARLGPRTDAIAPALT